MYIEDSEYNKNANCASPKGRGTPQPNDYSKGGGTAKLAGEERFSRTRRLIGTEAIEKLLSAKVAVFGIGGVGGFVCEALARAGVGNLTIIDKDDVEESNLNRQIIALHSTLGKSKVAAMKERIEDINPNAVVTCIQQFYLPENAENLPLEDFDYVVDAIDTVTSKLILAERAARAGVPIISSMGTGNKLDPTKFEVADIYKTSVCPLAKVMRKKLRERGVDSLKVVYSKEEPIKQEERTPASISFVPSVAGLIIAGEVIKDLINAM